MSTHTFRLRGGAAWVVTSNLIPLHGSDEARVEYLIFCLCLLPQLSLDDRVTLNVPANFDLTIDLTAVRSEVLQRCFPLHDHPLSYSCSRTSSSSQRKAEQKENKKKRRINLRDVSQAVRAKSRAVLLPVMVDLAYDMGSELRVKDFLSRSRKVFGENGQFGLLPQTKQGICLSTSWHCIFETHAYKSLFARTVLEVSRDFLKNGAVIASRVINGPQELQPGLSVVSRVNYEKIIRVAGKLAPSTHVTVITGEQWCLHMCMRLHE
jgi:hypothetical protein